MKFTTGEARKIYFAVPGSKYYESGYYAAANAIIAMGSF
jgi:hypothetical protein